MQLFLEIFSGVANTVDPNQTATSGVIWSGFAVFAYAILSDTWTFTVLNSSSRWYTNAANKKKEKKKKEKKKK